MSDKILENITKESKCFVCPLLKISICKGHCYDVQMIRLGYIKPIAIEEVFDKGEANILCERCSFNQLP